uniref:RING-type domain-containing protein n=1 Tax=Chromera velia CCMP2878 TaxID=1169474 RepID=A0A0G4FJS4_9ALVE|eukprot:Cvel_17381.t1-p1 / transcript=Cvel_17381.t1 / gene=Cvel_17381 / organism=Chromera_velia_CCMP2878 / gene_product=RING finger and transmembrane domain-containing, putative / transcript_product=RING finger and transmembrane domain-containing, putative / location=Cvel_scaffold1382:39577-43008(+) / protein_length=464 / sequence_SO=supercontig / SO=protein_coding / is_pseudo=false
MAAVVEQEQPFLGGQPDTPQAQGNAGQGTNPPPPPPEGQPPAGGNDGGAQAERNSEQRVRRLLTGDLATSCQIFVGRLHLLCCLGLAVYVCFDARAWIRSPCTGSPLKPWIVIHVFRHILFASLQVKRTQDMQAQGMSSVSDFLQVLTLVNFLWFFLGLHWLEDARNGSCDERIERVATLLLLLQGGFYILVAFWFLCISLYISWYILHMVMSERRRQRNNNGRGIIRELESGRYSEIMRRHREEQAERERERERVRRYGKHPGDDSSTNLVQAPGAAVAGGGGDERRHSISGEDSCPICLQDFRSNSIVLRMPCEGRHVFCKDCVVRWLNNSRLCPVCRADIVNIVESRNGPTASADGEGEGEADGEEEGENEGADTSLREREGEGGVGRQIDARGTETAQSGSPGSQGVSADVNQSGPQGVSAEVHRGDPGARGASSVMQAASSETPHRPDEVARSGGADGI